MKGGLTREGNQEEGEKEAKINRKRRVRQKQVWLKMMEAEIYKDA